MLTQNEVLAQSRAALEQWHPRWQSHARENGAILKRKGRPQDELLMCGIGRSVVCCGLGPSLTENIAEMRLHRDCWDVGAVDKAFAFLVERGVKPEFVCVADAMVSYEKYCEPYLKDTEGVALLMNVCANPKWAENWKGPVYFFVNKDNLKTEVEFSQLSGCTQAIPAASNVGDALVAFLMQVVSYDRYLLVGFDYCWKPDGDYYAGQWEDRKRSFMWHQVQPTEKGFVHTSSNLKFSARWMSQYIASLMAMGVAPEVRDCSDGILDAPKSTLEREAALILARGVKRPWTKAEKEEFVTAKRKSLTLAMQDFGKIPELLADKTMLTLNVTLNGIPRAVADMVGAG